MVPGKPGLKKKKRAYKITSRGDAAAKAGSI
jgi:hypothetical protein